MKTLKCIFWVLLSGCCLLKSAEASVYVYTADDGSVSLSNVPVDTRFKVLVADQKADVAAQPAVSAPKSLPGFVNKYLYNRIVDNAARAYGLDSALLHAVISVESHYNPKAVSRKGAAGLMQLMPGTARRYGVTDAFDPVQNINGGAEYLRDLMKLFNSDVSLALAAYNAGENVVAKYGNHIPPIRETMDYVPKVLAFYRKYQDGL